jgi:hypothetical protein
MVRDDLSERLIHLTRDFSGITGKERFKQILNQKKIIGNNNTIRGGSKVICFSEAPIASLGRLVALENEVARYSPYGFMFKKEHLYKLGARPVIYQAENEYDLLGEPIKYRHVRFEPNADPKVDWTWEREWRIKSDELILNPNEVTLIIPNRQIEEELKNSNHAHNIAMSIIEVPAAERFDWHFIVLEDLGFDIKLDVKT